MKVIYSTFSHLGGTGLSNVAFHAGRALYRDGSLERLITYRNKQNEIPRHLIKRLIFQPAKLFSHLPSRYYYSMKRMWTDYRTAQYLGKHDCDIFHSWTHECLNSMRVAKRQGAVTIVDRGNTHPHFSMRILDEEYAIYGIDRALGEAPRWLQPFDHWRREMDEACEELNIADYVFVNSPFCYDTYINEGFPQEKLVMLPRGFDALRYIPAPQPDTVFRVIFVGQLQVRKGLKYLLEAWERLALKDAELLLVGHLMGEMKPTMQPYLARPDIRHIGFVPDPVEAYNSATVFCFPSIDEGSAKVTYEAMACGLPVIVTPNAGSLATDQKDGFIVPIRNVEMLIEKLLYFYENRAAAVEMGMTARASITPYAWDAYEENLISTYRNLLNNREGKTHNA